jgi:hypothetical protein
MPPKDDSETIQFSDGRIRNYSQLVENAYKSQGERLTAEVHAEMAKAAEAADTEDDGL